MRYTAAVGASVFASAGLLLAIPAGDANAAVSTEQAYKQCRKELRGIGGGRGAKERRFNMLEDCVKRKMAR